VHATHLDITHCAGRVRNEDRRCFVLGADVLRCTHVTHAKDAAGVVTGIRAVEADGSERVVDCTLSISRYWVTIISCAPPPPPPPLCLPHTPGGGGGGGAREAGARSHGQARLGSHLHHVRRGGPVHAAVELKDAVLQPAARKQHHTASVSPHRTQAPARASEQTATCTGRRCVHSARNFGRIGAFSQRLLSSCLASLNKFAGATITTTTSRHTPPPPLTPPRWPCAGGPRPRRSGPWTRRPPPRP
jgi:hypothetical protein